MNLEYCFINAPIIPELPTSQNTLPQLKSHQQRTKLAELFYKKQKQNMNIKNMLNIASCLKQQKDKACGQGNESIPFQIKF